MTATIPEAFRAFLAEDLPIVAVVGNRVHRNRVPQSSDPPFIWFRRQGREEELTMDGDGGMESAQFDVECVASNLDVAEDLADLVRAALHGHRGDFGELTAKGVFVDDQDDDYEPRSISNDTGEFVAALRVEVIT